MQREHALPSARTTASSATDTDALMQSPKPTKKKAPAKKKVRGKVLMNVSATALAAAAAMHSALEADAHLSLPRAHAEAKQEEGHELSAHCASSGTGASLSGWAGWRGWGATGASSSRRVGPNSCLQPLGPLDDATSCY